jgi:hypothetical protein
MGLVKPVIVALTVLVAVSITETVPGIAPKFVM